MSSPNVETALRFVKAVEQGATGSTLMEFCHPDVSQHEYPNRLFPNGAHRDAQALRASSERGQQVLSSQRYEVRNAVAAGDHVALEIDWTGTLAIALGNKPAGSTLHAMIGQFITFRDGRIASIRNYDCYDPF
ncbi:nuclear transport factor 2 family protein [Hyalangium gracile]|uniref:nuclear transport factor 2 family protein n=1 Tax=Hyalangium gracile TaxID=394092 RepID=UPI001CCE87D8|nr:nuclear transport factor 2 family protein [Hyalangium gracile]